ncbi:hypothetical protein ARMGADRAFT_1167828 [Armillaria gallica]|uniref:Uncharacterized protein n=1 Tax=Armillaria gallica TaxID=47427 RepID=A0A2H3DLE5_ARMGA|nr:hypothetical protein ARMGADRAFT_1167828 [Armillaria gallica]
MSIFIGSSSITSDLKELDLDPRGADGPVSNYVVQFGEGGEGRRDNSGPYLGSLLALSGRNIRFDLSEAKEYLEREAASNTEMTGRAAAMLKAVKTRIGL